MLPLVLHVLPLDLARGPQRYARVVRERLDGQGARHRTVTIFRSPAQVLDADIKVEADHSVLARRGFDPRAALALRRTLRPLEPQVVIAYGSQPFKYLAAALPLGTPLIYRKIGVAHAPARKRSRQLFHTLLMKRASLLAGVSQECLDEARDWFGVPPALLQLVPNGRDATVFFPAESRPLNRKPCVTYVGHLTAGKRPELFIRIVQQLRAEGLALRGQLIGDGPEETRVRPLAEAAGVALLGRRDDVALRLRESDLLLVTALPDGEGMPGVLLEAGLSGLPCVSTRIPGASTAIVEGETGFVVDPGDEAQLKAYVRQLIVAPQLRQAMGEAARRHCLAHFTIERSLERWQHALRAFL